MVPKPYIEGMVKGGIKRTYWYESEVRAKDNVLKKSAASLVSKRGKPYSRSDQRKIVAEKWEAIKERHCRPEEC